jgi:hypothetical protein
MLDNIKIPIFKFQIPKLLLGISFLFFGISSYSQCAMCRAALDSSDNVKQAEGVNDGIVYLMAMPYLIVAVVGYVVYKMYNKKKV